MVVKFRRRAGPFKNEAEAKVWLKKYILDELMDNYRFAFLDDIPKLAKYAERAAKGCCASFDEVIIVDGRKAKIGCNYRHVATTQHDKNGIEI